MAFQGHTETRQPRTATELWAALAILDKLHLPSLDFEPSLQGGSGPGCFSFAGMLDGGFSGSGGFSGALSVPEPTTIALPTVGGVVLFRRRRTTY